MSRFRYEIKSSDYIRMTSGLEPDPVRQFPDMMNCSRGWLTTPRFLDNGRLTTDIRELAVRLAMTKEESSLLRTSKMLL
jgi:hypothetical protein